MGKYKLKKEARQFFDEKYHTKIYPLSIWEKELISINLLDEVENVYVDYGVKTSPNSSNLSGWSSNDGNPKAHFEFTVNVLDIENRSYESVKVAEVIDEIQKVLNKYFKRYVN